MPACPDCEFPVDPGRMTECPKCGRNLRGQPWQGVLEVDVAHSGETWDVAREKILRAVDRGVVNGHRGVRIIHGIGGGRGGGVIRKNAVPLLQNLSARVGGRLTPDAGNRGAHILWLGPPRRKQ
jgi:DNA-nicking Smr family endonuclease